MLYPKFSEKEYSRRTRLVKKLLDSRGLEGLIVYSSGSVGTVHYLTNYMGIRPTYLIYPLTGKPTLIVDMYNHIPCAKEMGIIDDIRWHYNDPALSVVNCLREKNLERSRIGVVSLGAIPFSHIQAIKKKLPKVKLLDVAREYNMIRWVRSEEELGWFKESSRLTDLTAYALEKKLKPGLSEHDLQTIVHDAFLGGGGQLGVAFVTSTNMARPDRFVPWQFPSTRLVKKGDVVITEITVAYYGYAAQIHRPFSVGVTPNRQYTELFDVALECYDSVSRALKPGATTKDILRATSVIEERGYTVFDSLVHGESGVNPELGSNSSVHTREDFTFRENMVVVIQPQPITRDRKAGLQLGAATVVTPNGAKSLHEYPFKFTVCNSKQDRSVMH